MTHSIYRPHHQALAVTFFCGYMAGIITAAIIVAMLIRWKIV